MKSVSFAQPSTLAVPSQQQSNEPLLLIIPEEEPPHQIDIINAMQKFAVVDPQSGNYLRSNYEMIQQHLFTDSLEIKQKFEEELKPRQQERKEKSKKEDIRFLDRFISYKQDSKFIKSKYTSSIIEIKGERDFLNDLSKKIASNVCYEGPNQKQFTFPLNKCKILKPKKSKNSIIGAALSKLEGLESKNKSFFEDGEVEKPDKSKEESEEEVVEEEEDNEDDKSNFDTTSVHSKSRTQKEREWEYSSQKDYNIVEIQKLTDLQDKDLMEDLVGIHQEINEQADKGKEDEKSSKQDAKIKDKQRFQKRRVGNTKIEKSLDEFYALNIHEKLQQVAQCDWIEKISLCFDLASEVHPDNMPEYYREISSQARDVMTQGHEFKGAYFEQQRGEILDIQDTYIDETNIAFSDLLNILGDRIPGDMISRYEDSKYLIENAAAQESEEGLHLETNEKVMYANQIEKVKNYNTWQMKRYYQKTKSWADKEFQSDYKDIVGETKTLTDWLMEDLFHIRKATISSQGLDFTPKLNTALQNQLYHKFEEKLLILLQMILFREPIVIDKNRKNPNEVTEQDLIQDRLKLEQLRQEDEENFSKLHHPEEELIMELKNVLKNIKQLTDKWIDGRSKSELLRIFLVDYNEIAKFKREQLSKIKAIEAQLEAYDKQAGAIRKKSAFQRLFEQKIGHIKDQDDGEVSDQRQLSEFTQSRAQLNKEKEQILLSSAQILTVEGPQDQQQQITSLTKINSSGNNNSNINNNNSSRKMTSPSGFSISKEPVSKSPVSMRGNDQKQQIKTNEQTNTSSLLQRGDSSNSFQKNQEQNVLSRVGSSLTTRSNQSVIRENPSFPGRKTPEPQQNRIKQRSISQINNQESQEISLFQQSRTPSKQNNNYQVGPEKQVSPFSIKSTPAKQERNSLNSTQAFSASSKKTGFNTSLKDQNSASSKKQQYQYSMLSPANSSRSLTPQSRQAKSSLTRLQDINWKQVLKRKG